MPVGKMSHITFGLTVFVAAAILTAPAMAQTDQAPQVAPTSAQTQTQAGTQTQTGDAPSSAAIGQPQAAAAQNDSIDQQIAAWTQGPASGNGGAPQGDQGPAPPRQIHGEAGVAFGSSGYRAGYITTDIPIGKDSDLGISVGESQIKPKHFGEITNKSLAISLRIGGGDLGGPINCASPTMAMDGRYLEPVWEARMHGEALARDQASCAGPATVAAPVSRDDAE